MSIAHKIKDKPGSMVTKLAKKDQKIIDEIVQSTPIATAMNEALWLGNSQHKTLYVNPMFEKISGYTLEEAIGKDCTYFFDKESKRIIDHHHKIREKGGSTQYEATMINKDGSKVPLLISGCPVGQGGTMGIFTNLTQIKELSKQERYAKEIIQHSTEAIVILDSDRTVQLWNDGATSMFGYKEHEVIHKSIEVIIPKDLSAQNEHLIDIVNKKGHIENIETKRLSKNGDQIDVNLSVTKVLGDANSTTGFLVIYRDITEQKRINSELQKRFEAIQDAYKELGLQRRYLDYLGEIINTATGKTSLEDLERLIISAFSLITKCDSAILRYYDKKRDVLTLRNTFGVTSKWESKDQITFKNSIAEDAFRNGRALIIDDVDAYQKHQGTKLLKAHKLKALIIIPLSIEDKLLGTISLYATDPAKFRLIETDFLEKMGKQCSLALYVKRSIERV